MSKQRGLTMTGFLVTAVLLLFVALFGFKVGPAYMEFFSIQRNLKIVATEPAAASGLRRDVEAAFQRRADVDDIRVITAKDLEITKNGDQIVITANYSVQIPLVGNMSACLDFKASSAK